MVEPVDPFEGSELDGLEGTPGSAPVNQLGLIEPIDRVRHGVVVGIADTPYRRLDALDRQPFGVFDGNVLTAAIRMMNESVSARVSRRAAVFVSQFTLPHRYDPPPQRSEPLRRCVHRVPHCP